MICLLGKDLHKKQAAYNDGRRSNFLCALVLDSLAVFIACDQRRMWQRLGLLEIEVTRTMLLTLNPFGVKSSFSGVYGCFIMITGKSIFHLGQGGCSSSNKAPAVADPQRMG